MQNPLQQLFTMIGEAVYNQMAGGQGQHPGFTQSQMMTNQGPMMSPSQDPRQFDVPFRTPYGPNSAFKKSDVKNGTFGLRDKEQTGEPWGGNYTVTQGPLINSEAMADSLASRMQSAGVDYRPIPYALTNELSRHPWWAMDNYSSESDALDLLRRYGKLAAEHNANSPAIERYR